MHAFDCLTPRAAAAFKGMRFWSMAALASFAFVAAIAAPALKLHARFHSAEHSMDSNSTTEVFDVTDGKLRYTYDYGGYHPRRDFPRHREESARIDRAALETLIRNKRLNVSRQIKLPPGQPHARSAELEISLQMGGASFEQKYQGALPEPGASAEFDDAMELIAFLRRALPAPQL